MATPLKYFRNMPVAGLALCVLLFAGGQRRALAAPAATAPIQTHRSGPVTIEVFSEDGGNRLRFVASNVSPDVVDLRMSFALTNMAASSANPVRMLLTPQRIGVPVAEIARVKEDAPFRYGMTFSAFFGDPAARNTATYAPPIPLGGGSFTVANAFFGFGAHQGETAHSVDIPMPEGTPVHAARAGVVVRIKSDSDRGGPDKAFANDANYVIVRHEDGTYGNYAHFKKDGVLVLVGQLVLKGSLLGLSGNTGWSTGPHLHFHVAVADGKGSFASVPWQFELDGQAVTPSKGLLLRR